MLIAVFCILGAGALSFTHLPAGIPFQVLFFPLGILFSTIQALVFTLLSSVYFLLVLPHEEEH
jgi:F-type H+-transporting ATPase subunit a